MHVLHNYKLKNIDSSPGQWIDPSSAGTVLYPNRTQCWKFPQVRRSEADNFGGGPGTFCWFLFNFMFMIWDSRHEDLQLFLLSFKHWQDLSLAFTVLAGPWFNKKMSSYQYRKSHCGDKTILRPSYLHNGISYTGMTTSLYQIRAQMS